MRYLLTSSRKSAAQTKIDDFASLTDGWHYGGGVAPSEVTRNLATSVLENMQMLGLTSLHVSAGPDGEILLAASALNEYFAITVEAEGTFVFNHERNNEEVSFFEGISFRELMRHLVQSTGTLWNTSGLYTQGHSIANETSSMIWHLRSHPEEGCQFLRFNAPKRQVA